MPGYTICVTPMRFCPCKTVTNIKTVQGNLGHATAAFTLDVYGHVSERMKEDSANRMQQYIENL